MTDSIDWDQVSKNGRDYVTLSTASLSFILDKLPKENTNAALDVGCGTGQVCRDLFHRGFDVTGVDISKEAVKQAKESTKYIGKGIDFIQCDIEADELSKEKKDLITCKYVYAFLNERKTFLKSIASAMHSDSLFVIISPSVEYVPPLKKHIAVEHSEIMKELSSYFSSIEHVARNRDEYYFCKR